MHDLHPYLLCYLYGTYAYDLDAADIIFQILPKPFYSQIIVPQTDITGTNEGTLVRLAFAKPSTNCMRVGITRLARRKPTEYKVFYDNVQFGLEHGNR